ncbi:hypothetical protein SAMN05421771_2358 [Granulicella pectinivorans]|jgi:hypothetical protein|uniref:Uncharacterized protein n=1 Tax=Granulicella pectinivorans TaxID=474950 RepID=A0A1I6MDG3_9BACT|nr:hypothetical protein [Granulicella pectinivorans]SFS13637.1 hypothetical protein SAMN05421771_2358 [Granulicella pectinivorans]
MPKSYVVLVSLLSSAFALSQPATGVPVAPPSSRTVLPITFTKTVSADHSHAGDTVLAKTTQVVRLATGEVVPAGTEVVGHVAAANAFLYDNTPYAKQREAVLDIQFDALHLAGHDMPLSVTVRAMADPLTSRGARMPKPSDLDSYSAVSQIGGDELVPSQSEVVDRNGDVVAYNRRSGVYAHLIANGSCDASSNEVSVDIYSASACGLYGFTEVTARETGSASSPSRLSLISTHTSPKIWRYSTALLEVLPSTGAAR